MELVEKIASLVKKDDATIVEIGANGGENTVDFYTRFPAATIHVFEPDPRAIALFQGRRFDPRVILNQCAVGAYSGTIEFFQSSGAPPGAEHERWEKGWDMSGSIRKPTGHLTAHTWCKFDTTIQVPITTLDDWRQRNGVGIVDFMWADVQGAEIDVINGGPETLRNTRFFYTEFSDEEMYEGELNLQGILDALPLFEVVEVFQFDVLLRNKLLSG